MEDTKNEEQYIKGYNDGYLLSRFEPELYKKVANGTDQANDYIEGMTDGHRAHERELFLQNLQNSREVNKQISRPKRR